MELTVPIIVVDGVVDGLCQQRSSLTEAAVGWDGSDGGLALR